MLAFLIIISKAFKSKVAKVIPEYICDFFGFSCFAKLKNPTVNFLVKDHDFRVINRKKACFLSGNMLENYKAGRCT